MDSDDDQTKDVYAHYGLAMYFAQTLEHGIVNALVILKLPDKDKFTRTEIDEFTEERFQNTLGHLLKQLKSEAALTPTLELMLTSALKRRNFLAHHYFRERAESFITRNGRAQMVEELQLDQHFFENADEELAKALTPLRVKHGVTDGEIENEYMRMCQQLGMAPENYK